MSEQTTAPARRPTLMELAQDAIALEQLIFEERGELSETLEKWLSEVQGNLAVKVDHYQFALQRFESTAEMLRERAEQMSKAARAVENVHAALKDRIKVAMEQMGIDEVHGTDYRFKRVKGKDRVLIRPELVAPTFFTERVVRELDKEKLVQAATHAVSNNQELPAGIQFEPTFQLRPYVKK